MRHQTAPAWPYFAAIITIFVVMAAITGFKLLEISTNCKQPSHLEGCLEWCQVHGVYDTPEQYLDCANRCEVKLNEKRP